MEEEINIDEVLFPNSWELQEDEDGLLTAEIVDEEIDNFKCSFKMMDVLRLIPKAMNILH